MVGGVRPAEDSNKIAEVEAHAKAAVAELLHSDGTPCVYEGVTDVTTQVVAGSLDTAKVSHNCGGVSKTCGIKIWSKPWLNFTQKEWTCEEYKNRKISKRETLVGGATPVDESEFGTLEQMVVDALAYGSAKDDAKNYK